jgi:hypothetical protein
MYVRGLFVHQMCSNYALTNLLYGLCRSIWIIDPVVIHPSSHPGILTHPFYFEMLWIREHTPTRFSSVVSTFKLAFEFFKECGGASLHMIRIIFVLVYSLNFLFQIPHSTLHFRYKCILIISYILCIHALYHINMNNFC